MKNNKNLTSAIIISITLHLLLVAALLWGTDFNMSKPRPTGNLIHAVVIDPAMVQKQAKEIREKRKSAANTEQERLDKLRKQSEQLEKTVKLKKQEFVNSKKIKQKPIKRPALQKKIEKSPKKRFELKKKKFESKNG